MYRYMVLPLLLPAGPRGLYWNQLFVICTHIIQEPEAARGKTKVFLLLLLLVPTLAPNPAAPGSFSQEYTELNPDPGLVPPSPSIYTDIEC